MAMRIYHEIGTNMAKTWAFMLGFFVFVIGVGFVMAQAYGNPSILYGAVIFSIIMNIGSYWYSDKIVLSLNRARPADMNDPAELELSRIVENLAITAGLPTPKLYIVDDPAANAFATGRDKNHAVVAVTTGILAILDKSELEGVLAHELSHVGNRDTLISTVVVVLVGFVTMLCDFFMRMSFWGGGRSRDNERGGNIFAVLGIVLAIVAPILATLTQLAISRRRESLADASGALLTRYPEALASALIKISQNPVPLSRANPALAHLYIVNPFKGNGAGRFLVKLFMTHPPVEERVAALRGMNVEEVRKELDHA